MQFQSKAEGEVTRWRLIKPSTHVHTLVTLPLLSIVNVVSTLDQADVDDKGKTLF